MDREEIIWRVPGPQPVPKTFWSDLTGNPFDKCIQCERNLLEDGVGYMVEKAFQKYKERVVTETVFEYAMCDKCRDQLTQILSVETRQRMEAFFAPHFNFAKRVLQRKGNWEVEGLLQHCIVDEEEPSESGTYQIVAQCEGPMMFTGLTPFMIRGEALERVIDLISDKSMDELDNFTNKNFTGPPEFKEILSNGPRVLI